MRNLSRTRHGPGFPLDRLNFGQRFSNEINTLHEKPCACPSFVAFVQGPAGRCGRVSFGEAAHFVNSRDRNPAAGPRVWAVGALCRAVADALDARFNPVCVRGEISGLLARGERALLFLVEGRKRAAALRDVPSRGGAARLLAARWRPGRGARAARGATSRAAICNWWSKACGARGRGPCSSSSSSARRELEAEGLVRCGAQAGAAGDAASVGVVTSLGAAALA